MDKKRGGMVMMLLLCSMLGVFGCGGCSSPQPGGEQPQNPQMALNVLRGLGDAVVRVDGTAAIQRYAPEAMKLVDVGVADASGVVSGAGDGVVTLAEFEQLVRAAQDPEQLVWLFVVVRSLIDGDDGKVP